MLGGAVLLALISWPLRHRYGAGAIVRWLCIGVAIALVAIWLSQVI